MTNQDFNLSIYLQARLAEGDRRPDLHEHISKVYQGYLDIISTRPNDYAKEAGDMFAVMKAEQMDRARNNLSLSTKLEQSFLVKAYTKLLSVVSSATGYVDIHTKIKTARDEMQDLLTVADQQRNHLIELCSSLVFWRCAPPQERNGKAAGVLKAWLALLELDSELSWEKICSFKPYRYCLCYTDDQMQLLGVWLEEIKK